MFHKQPNHLVALIDSAIALFIIVYSFLPLRRVLDAVHSVPYIQIGLPDALFGVLFIFAWHYCFSVLNLYNKFATVPSRMGVTLKATVLMVLPVVLYLRVFHPAKLTLKGVTSAVVTLFCYEILRLALNVSLLDWIASRHPRRAIIVGSGRRASKAWRSIRTRYHSSIWLMGFVDDRLPHDMPPDVERRFLGTVDQLGDLLLREAVDMILIAMPIQSCYPLMQKAVHIAEAAGVQVVYLEDIYSSQHRKDDLGETLFRDLAPRQENYLIRLAAKRALDICGALVGMVVLSPLFGIIALGVKLTSKGPVLYCQDRYGYRRRRFKLFKFRSMVQDAEKLLPSLEASNEARGPIFKIKNDPRVTKFGQSIRATSLDELPQLWNVLMGEMSLVGPRPMTVRDVSLFDEAAIMRRFSVKPGMTGLLQVSGRSAVGFDEWMVMDNRYIDGWSLLLDIQILARTVAVVLKRNGAM